MPDADLDQLAPALAKWLAPYIAAELGILAPNADSTNLSADYDERTAALFVEGLGDEVLQRAYILFAILSVTESGGDASIDSIELARMLDLSTPRNIASVLTNSLKRRAKKLGLPVPWTQSTTSDNRTRWTGRDKDGAQARRLMYAIRAELQRRGLRYLDGGDPSASHGGRSDES